MTLNSKINLNNISIDDVKKLLIKEYGYLLPQLENLTSLEIKEIDLSSLKYHKNLMDKLVISDLAFYSEINEPIIILKKENHLIDGYHRVALALNLKKTHILAIVLD